MATSRGIEELLVPPGLDVLKLAVGGGPGLTTHPYRHSSMGQPLPFVRKVRQLVTGYPDVFAWGADGKSFVVRDMKAVGEVLPLFFNHNCFASLVRQLNMCGVPLSVPPCSPSSAGTQVWVPQGCAKQQIDCRVCPSKLPTRPTRAVPPHRSQPCQEERPQEWAQGGTRAHGGRPQTRAHGGRPQTRPQAHGGGRRGGRRGARGPVGYPRHPGAPGGPTLQHPVRMARP
jgi:hypothetical protein